MLGNLGKYQLLEVLGTGGQGTVYRARDPVLDRMVAVKVVRQDLAHDENYLSALFLEARVAGGLNHPNITVVYDLDIVDDKPYIAMELLQSSLSSRLENGVRLPFQEAVQMTIAICNGLEHCHANDVIHRDIKPQNILLTSDGQPKLTDFGIARPPESTTRAAQHQAGTVTYMSPEQITGTSTDGRSDIYSLGVVLYEMLSGSPPFVGETEFQVLSAHVNDQVPRMSPRLGIPPQLEEIVTKALAKRPENRFVSANDMGAALERILPSGGGQERLASWPAGSGTSASPLSQRSPNPLRNLGSLANASEFESYPLPGEYKPVRPQSSVAPDVSTGPSRQHQPVVGGERLSFILRHIPRNWMIALLCLIGVAAVSWTGVLPGSTPLPFFAGNQDSIEDLSKAIQLDPENVVPYIERGYAYNNLGEYQRAILDLDKAIQLDPENAVAYNNRGYSYNNLGEYQRAILDFDKAIQLDPESVANYSRGYAYLHLGQHQQAIGDFDKAIQLDIDFARAYKDRGSAYNALGQTHRAVEDFDKAIRLDSDDAMTYIHRGSAYFGLGEHEQAVQDFDKAIQLNPENAVAYHNRGYTYSKQKNLQEAIGDFDKAIQLDPDFAMAYSERGYIYSLLGEQIKMDADKAKACSLDSQYC